jgi:hypothetical protein
LCLVAEEYLRHDLVFQETRDLLGDQQQELDHANPNLRSIIYGSALGESLAS